LEGGIEGTVKVGAGSKGAVEVHVVPEITQRKTGRERETDSIGGVVQAGKKGVFRGDDLEGDICVNGGSNRRTVPEDGVFNESDLTVGG
jgi:hypothetical protein